MNDDLPPSLSGPPFVTDNLLAGIREKGNVPQSTIKWIKETLAGLPPLLIKNCGCFK